MKQEITFIPRLHGKANSSQYEFAPGAAWRLILRITVLLSAMIVFRFISGVRTRHLTGAPSASAKGAEDRDDETGHLHGLIMRIKAGQQQNHARQDQEQTPGFKYG
jgi:hypothetical protein